MTINQTCFKYTTYEYKFEYSALEYEYKYLKCVLKYYSSTSTSTKYYNSAINCLTPAGCTPTWYVLRVDIKTGNKRRQSKVCSTVDLVVVDELCSVKH